MAYAINISARAQRDLAHIYQFINADDSEAARNWYRGLHRAILNLEELPNRWPATHENRGLRHILYGNKPHIYRVIYRILERQKRVEILHIRHGARDHS
jgi:plasmid stabilization system protein ParE